MGEQCRHTGGQLEGDRRERGQQWRPSHGLEHPGLGTLSHRDAGQGGADRGDVTRAKQSGHKHGDHRAGSMSRYQETQADKRSVAGGARTRTTTLQTSTRRTTAWHCPQYAGEWTGVRSCGAPRAQRT